MSAGEIGWRLRRSAAVRLERARGDRGADGLTYPGSEVPAALDGFRASRGRPVLFDGDRAQRIARSNPSWAADVLAAADRAMQLRFGYFGYDEVQLPVPVDWHLDPLANVRWDPTNAVDYRTADADVKWIWELNRLQHLPWLAQAWLITGNADYGTAAFEQLDSWIEQNPPNVGMSWRNPFEPGVRAISIALALQGFRDHPELTEERFARYAELLAASAHRCDTDRSRFSSANNHLIGEMAGLAVVAIVLPDLPLARQWERRALTVLTSESDRQILADGAGAEQAVGYQMFTVELMLVVGALLLARDGAMPREMCEAISRSATYLTALVAGGDPAPRYGDDDEGFALRLDSVPLRTISDHLGIVAALTGSPEAGRGGTASWSAEWFGELGAGHAPVEKVGTTLLTRDRNHYAPDGGLVVLRRGTSRVLMDVAPLGYLSIAAHGHADALAVTTSLDGLDVIGDPGAASYYGHPDWRRVHRGTRVHATVEVDGCDQSVMAGPFMWSRHARTRVLAVDLERGIVDAEHDGYRRLGKPVTHRRWLIAAPTSDEVVVVDLLSGDGEHEIRTSWPLAPSLDVEAAPCGHLVKREGAPLLVIASAATAPLDVEGVRGDVDSGLGWWSDRLESREPSWLVGASYVGALPHAVATVLHPVTDGWTSLEPTVTLTGGVLDVSWSASDGRHSLLIDTARFGAVHSERPGARG